MEHLIPTYNMIPVLFTLKYYEKSYSGLTKDF